MMLLLLTGERGVRVSPSKDQYQVYVVSTRIALERETDKNGDYYLLLLLVR